MMIARIQGLGGVGIPSVNVPGVSVALDEGELNPETLLNLLEDPSMTEKKSKKYALKIKDLTKKYSVHRHCAHTPPSPSCRVSCAPSLPG